MPEYVTVKELAKEFGMDKSNARKYLTAQGFSMFKVRTAKSRGQLTLALSVEDAETARELRRDQGFSRHQEPVTVDNGLGYFYIVQLVPDLDPLRVKLGYTSNVENRLQAHRTSAPTAEVAKTWPCKKVWEQTAIDSVTRVGCELIANEVFSCDSVNDLINRTETFFAVLPNLATGEAK